MTSCPPYYAPMSSDEPEESSVSTVVATAVGTGHHTLRIQGYSRLETMHGGNGSYVESNAFKAAGHTWRIRCYLDGERPEDAGFVSLFLRRDPADAGAAESVVHAECEFALVHHQGTLVKWPSHYQRLSASAFSSSHMWGIPQFISKEDLEGSRFLKDDCFAVRCKVTAIKQRSAKEEEDASPPALGRRLLGFCSSICG
ncbi:hypothetical protein CFC21_015240 [Triticum aestivum]|uniref:MATH domain-containing protein n=2 Tax=Triticum aestivum TaxID=4565 RepID=A0A3B6ASM1_WHEAT|nr:hypothetical protein CFC21_015240 [Triticum aestivum]